MVKFMGHLGIESYPTDIQRILAIHLQHIDLSELIGQYLFQCLGHKNRITQMPGKTIATPQRNDPKSNITTTQSSSHLIHCTIPPNRYNMSIFSFLPGIFDQFTGMSCILGKYNIIRNRIILRNPTDLLRQFFPKA